MAEIKIFDESGKELCISDVISSSTKFKQYGTGVDGAIFYINEAKLNQDHIRQIRNYLDFMEKKLKRHK